ncbi:penicillin-insensitive murein endopeptidase [Sandaracinus amylolyticus]|uniref:penicillin-insensitive murein endopeptidase n=1 Tax=Sandaracinus amylolyticus TaxID=927083 RepID=UPI001F189251|nr:penicillin-insensitive murein endopeptidase [Sandaracinus amylolyticus]UJR81959.1 Penicillin-insensitive murein endopeptidase [Sandaracinus amylolyticus]
MRRSAAVLLAIAIALLATVARATPGDHDDPRPRRARRATPSTSVGLPFRGRLRNGVLLRESEHVRYAGEYREGGRFYGTDELVQLIERSAARVSQRLPGARLSVGELSARQGGRVSGHRSHQNGRDVDIAFYMIDRDGRPYDPWGFAAFDRHGNGMPPNDALRFDDARNWELVARLVADPDARVQYVFVADTLRRRLLATARRRRAPASIVARAEQLLVQPSHGHPHRNHFHVRIYCPPADRPTCEDREPFHAWYPGTPPRSESASAEDAAD